MFIVEIKIRIWSAWTMHMFYVQVIKKVYFTQCYLPCGRVQFEKRNDGGCGSDAIDNNSQHKFQCYWIEDETKKDSQVVVPRPIHLTVPHLMVGRWNHQWLNQFDPSKFNPEIGLVEKTRRETVSKIFWNVE